MSTCCDVLGLLYALAVPAVSLPEKGAHLAGEGALLLLQAFQHPLAVAGP